MIKFSDFVKYKINEATLAPDKIGSAPPVQSPIKSKNLEDLFQRMENFKKKMGIKIGITQTGTTTGSGVGIKLEVNTNFTIKSHRGHKYNITYAAIDKKNRNIPLYYVQSDDEEIVNVSGITFIEDEKFKDVNELLTYLKSWREQIATPVPATAPITPAANAPTAPVTNPVTPVAPATAPSTAPATAPATPTTSTNPGNPTTNSLENQKANASYTYSDNSKIFEDIVQGKQSRSVKTVGGFDQSWMSELGNIEGFFKNFKGMNRVSIIIDNLKTIKGYGDMKYFQFVGWANQLKPISEKSKLYTKWYIEKKGADDEFIIAKFGNTIQSGSLLNICKLINKIGDDTVKVDLNVSSIIKK